MASGMTHWFSGCPARFVWASARVAAPVRPGPVSLRVVVAAVEELVEVRFVEAAISVWKREARFSEPRILGCGR